MPVHSRNSRNLQPTLASAGLSFEVLSSHEFPGGSLVWLLVAPHDDGLAPPEAARDLVIGETGVVARLDVTNPFSVELLLRADLVLEGGKQARVVERSVIVPSSVRVSIPVRCVEAGRWHARAGRSAERFEITSSATTNSRERLAQMKQRALRTHKRFDLDQGEVWDHVTSELVREELASPTSSYSAVIAKRAARVREAGELGVQAPPDANGVALVRRRGACWVEAFPSHAHLGPMVAALVADLQDEPMHVAVTVRGDRLDRSRPPSERSERAAMDRAASAVARILAAPLVAVEAPPGTKGEGSAVDGDGIAGAVLMRDRRLAHLAVSVADSR